MKKALLMLALVLVVGMALVSCKPLPAPPAYTGPWRVSKIERFDHYSTGWQLQHAISINYFASELDEVLTNEANQKNYYLAYAIGGDINGIYDKDSSVDIGFKFYYTESAGTYLLNQIKNQNGTTETNRYRSFAYSSGKLASYIEDSVGTVSISRNSSGKLATIARGTSTFTSTYTFDGDKLASRKIVKGTLDNTWNYEYDVNGLLVKATKVSTSSNTPIQQYIYSWEPGSSNIDLTDPEEHVLARLIRNMPFNPEF